MGTTFLSVSLRILIFLICFGSIYAVNGQADSLFFTNSSAWEEDRYPDVKGTPYFFEDFVKADIYRRDSFKFSDVLLNYNGFTNQFEVRQGEKYIVLESLWYRTIKVDADKNTGLETDIVFATDVHPTLKGKFRQVLYEGEEMTLLYDFKVDKSESKKEIPGKTLVLEKFEQVGNYHLIQGKKITHLQPKKDVIAKHLGREKDFYKFLKTEKIKRLHEKQNMVRAMAWYDAQ